VPLPRKKTGLNKERGENKTLPSITLPSYQGGEKLRKGKVKTL